MEIKAALNKPFTQKQKLDFIVIQNHNNGYEIKETETTLEAWGDTEEETLKKLKEAKYKENDQKAQQARVSQEFTITLNESELHFDTTRETQQDLLTAKDFLSAGAEKYDWWDNNGTYFAFTSEEEILQISAAFMEKANIYPIWSYYKDLIDKATTKQELEGLYINYNIKLGEQNDITNENLPPLDSREQ